MKEKLTIKNLQTHESNQPATSAVSVSSIIPSLKTENPKKKTPSKKKREKTSNEIVNISIEKPSFL